MKSFRTASLADQVFEKLEDDIVYGVYKRGEILTELKLAETLGVSRTPIREALPAATITAPQTFSGNIFRIVSEILEIPISYNSITSFLKYAPRTIKFLN